MNYKEKYREYLRSNDWKIKKSNKLKKTKNCAICNKKNNLDIHHIFYKSWYDVENSDLRILCRECHYKTHELIKEGVIKFKDNTSHHSRFATIKNKVKSSLGYGNRNLFNGNKV